MTIKKGYFQISTCGIVKLNTEPKWKAKGREMTQKARDDANRSTENDLERTLMGQVAGRSSASTTVEAGLQRYRAQIDRERRLEEQLLEQLQTGSGRLQNGDLSDFPDKGRL